MKNILMFFICLLITPAGTCRNSDTSGNLQITYIANEGFLVSAYNKKVLIDALFKSKNYTSPSDSTAGKIISSTAPLNDINYLLVTHAHQDHFNQNMCAEFLRNNTKVKFISTSESCKMINDAGFDSPQLISCNLEYGEIKEMKDGDITITAFRLMHGTSPEINNLAYIIKINDFTVMHVGDGFILQNEEYLKKINWENYTIDVLFIGYMDVNTFVLETLSKTIKPKNLVLMHIHKGDIQEATERNENCSANGIIFEKELETKTFYKK
jgi:L-ascorbate metabolism protein UlaG (beta-lactamase superfamily)